MYKQMMCVFKKEIKSIFRDKKTFFFSIIFPIILIPLLLLLMYYTMTSNIKNQTQNVLSISINDENNALYRSFSQNQNIKILKTEDAKSAIENETILANIIIPEDFDQKLNSYENVSITIQTDKNSANNLGKIATLKNHIKDFSSSILSGHLELHGLPSNLQNQIEVKTENFGSSVNASIETFFTVIISMFLLLLCCLGTGSVAADLTAGEKEKSTFEYLLATGADRRSILLGKLLATNLMGILCELCALAGLVVSKFYMNSFQSLFEINFTQIFSIFLIFIFVSISLSAINLAIGTYSRSYIESQTYLTVTSLIVSLPAALVYNVNIKNLPPKMLHTPILNIVCIVKEILNNVFNFNHILTVIAWLLVYSVLSFCYAHYAFNKEKFMFRV